MQAQHNKFCCVRDRLFEIQDYSVHITLFVVSTAHGQHVKLPRDEAIKIIFEKKRVWGCCSVFRDGFSHTALGNLLSSAQIQLCCVCICIKESVVICCVVGVCSCVACSWVLRYGDGMTEGAVTATCYAVMYVNLRCSCCNTNQ